MRHAIMVIGTGNDASILQKTINHLDDENIDFFVHWDAKYKKPLLRSNISKIIFIERQKVNWGGDSQVFTEYRLLKAVFENQKEYDYVHLISSSDMPLMKKAYFKNYFSKDLYLGFLPDSLVDNRIEDRLKYYWLADYINARSKFGKLVTEIFKSLNKLLRVNRLRDKKVKIGKGPNWFSMKYKLVPKVINYPNMNIFNYSFCADELYLQTILNSYNPNINIDDNEMAARYIDWKRGKPYTFTINDVEELKQLVNTKYAFARKISDFEIVDEVFKD
ncbi:MAG: beta-1,6-N-acetylglucosaminyltransferase [Lactobacillus sp.]|nr:beta-1,6-N-acetylglucosaminyltransferase [Lactobacillus sp.]